MINNRSERTEVKVPVWEAEIPAKCRMKRLLYSYKDGYTTEYEEYLVEDGEVVANMGRIRHWCWECGMKRSMTGYISCRVEIKRLPEKELSFPVIFFNI